MCLLGKHVIFEVILCFMPRLHIIFVLLLEDQENKRATKLHLLQLLCHSGRYFFFPPYYNRYFKMQTAPFCF